MAVQVVNERFPGLDGHEKPMVACVLTPEDKETHTLSSDRSITHTDVHLVDICNLSASAFGPV